MPTFTPFPPPSRLMRLGFVGGGAGAFIGAIHAQAARLSSRWEIVAGALSSDPDRARQSGREWLLPSDRTYADFRTMARAEAAHPQGIDAVAIVTPNHLHAPVAEAFLAEGIDVICDKPLAPTVEDALRLVEAQQASGLVFGVTYAYAAYSMVRQARAMIRAGELGDLRQIHVEYFQEFAATLIADAGGKQPWRVDPARSGGSFTTGDIGTHAVHLASFVTGQPATSVRADFHVSGEPKDLEDTAFCHMRFGCVPGTLMVSQAAIGNQCGLRLRVFGTKAALDWNQERGDELIVTPFDAPAQRYQSGFAGGLYPEARRLARMPRGCPEGILEAWANLYTELGLAVEARRTGQVLPDGMLGYPTVKDAAAGVAFVEAAVRSNESGSWEDCELNASTDEGSTGEPGLPGKGVSVQS
ncbi:Gfo/Idh/MocA family oxidoreductase [Rubellimicrobium rubrum]|uniref:Gfo/Idh/MocA family oxidoreductase n=1 Tax=Rubellimicrobium rubrum TaxID=2585369 RepID=A0A5C4MRJ3_9RHOB|nr:Gfo/Idh/MocA family oxidoreductase [Rubellimicrobium rubrum]TNC46726.1 Gfo/Idh/MocA family oxidoreductase [Rubellimicrobium rubrum]